MKVWNLKKAYINNIKNTDIKMITALTVNYNTPELLESLLKSFRWFYPDIPYVVVDGSSVYYYEKIKDFSTRYSVSLHHFEYNIHHGPGMAYGMETITTDQILLLDSDIQILKGGFIEDLQSKLNPESYGIGDVSKINRDGVSIEGTGIKYLHPSCALINRAVALKYPLPTKHGAPMIKPMEGQPQLQHEQWVADDLIHSLFDRAHPTARHYFVHEWSGTVSRTGGMHL